MLFKVDIVWKCFNTFMVQCSSRQTQWAYCALETDTGFKHKFTLINLN